MRKMSYEEWQDKYYNEEIIEISKFFNKSDKNILKKFNIVIKNKLYTKDEYATIKYKLFEYYEDEEDTEEDRKFKKSLNNVYVTKEQLNKLLEKCSQIDRSYNMF